MSQFFQSFSVAMRGIAFETRTDQKETFKTDLSENRDKPKEKDRQS